MLGLGLGINKIMQTISTWIVPSTNSFTVKDDDGTTFVVKEGDFNVK